MSENTAGRRSSAKALTLAEAAKARASDRKKRRQGELMSREHGMGPESSSARAVKSVGGERRRGEGGQGWSPGHVGMSRRQGERLASWRVDLAQAPCSRTLNRSRRREEAGGRLRLRLRVRLRREPRFMGRGGWATRDSEARANHPKWCVDGPGGSSMVSAVAGMFFGRRGRMEHKSSPELCGAHDIRHPLSPHAP